MNKLSNFLKAAFALTLFGPCIALILFSIFVEINTSMAAITALVGTLSGYVLLPLLPFTYASFNFWISVITSIISLESELYSLNEICIFACCTAVLILPFIGAKFAKSKPMVYRVFVYLPLLLSFIYNMFFNALDTFWAKPFLTDIVYLILAIRLDIMISKRRFRL